MRDISQRRTSHERALARAAAAYPSHTPDAVRKLAGNRKPCSCWMCGNPRRYAKGAKRLTRQELRAVAADMSDPS